MLPIYFIHIIERVEMPISEWMKAIRDIVGHDLVVMVGASAVVLDDKGHILLQQRSDNRQWGIPGGGIEPGEEPAISAIREVFEETGLEVEITRLIGIFGGKDQVKQYPNGDKFAYISVTFECRVIGGDINPDPDETLDAKWFDLDNLPDNFVDVHQRRISAWQDDKLPFFEVPSLENYSFAQTNYIANIRKKIGNMLLMSPGVTALIFDDSGSILVERRRDDGLWNFPSGAYEVGEEPAEIVIREVYEETGLFVRPTRLVGIYGGEEFVRTYPNQDVVAYIGFVFVCEVVSGNLQIDETESLELCWVDPLDLPEPFTDHHRTMIDHALNRSETYFARDAHFR